MSRRRRGKKAGEDAERLLQEAFGVSEDQLLKDFILAQTEVKDSDIPPESEDGFERLMAKLEAEVGTSPESEKESSSENIVKLHEEVRKPRRLKTIVKVSVAAASFSIYAFNSLTEVMGGFLQVSDVESRSYVPFNEFDKVESNICMDFRLKVFHSVACNLSFTKASRELFISQPAISKHIHELEVQYKTPLFERTGSQIRLTRAGELLFSHTHSLLASYRQLDFEMNLLTNNFLGDLHLGASTTISQYVLPPVLALFIKMFPDIHVSVLNGNSRDIELALRDGKITLGLVEGTTRQNTMHYIPFMKDELVVVTHVGSKLAAYDELTLEQLCALPVVLRENGSGTLEVLEGTLAKHQIKLSQLNVLLQLGSTESIKLFLENSDALGILSIRAVTRELMAGRLKVIEIEGFKAERTFSFVEPQGQNSGMEESFMRFASQHWQ